MAENTPATNGVRLRSEPEPIPVEPDAIISSTEFQASFGEDIRQTLDLATWRVGVDMSHEYLRIDREVREAVARESELQKQIRFKVFPALKDRPGAPRNAGTHVADRSLIEKLHREFLFNGNMEACAGSIQVHDTLPLTIYQIGVSLVSYQGDQGTWGQRLFRRDLQQNCADPAEEALAILQDRAQRGAADKSDALGEMAQKAILQYAERAILQRRSTACWRMGHGNPITYELLTGGGNLELMVAATKVLREFVEVQQKFVFVGQEPRERMLFTIAQALRPMEFAIVSTLDERLEHWLHQKRFTIEPAKLAWDQEEIGATEWIPRVIRELASKIVVGLFRASPVAPAQMFYAHVDHADYAAHMVMADSLLQEHRGRPLLTELGRHVCASVFGNSLETLTETAYAAAGVPWGYVSE